MFCSKCGNPLPDDAKFCSACGAPVKISQEDSPVQQRPAGIADEVENIQVPKPEPLMAAQNFSVQMSGAAARGKKSKKRACDRPFCWFGRTADCGSGGDSGCFGIIQSGSIQSFPGSESRTNTDLLRGGSRSA